MTIKTDSYVIGSNADDTRNFLLDTDLAGALRIRRRSDGSGGVLATFDNAGQLTLAQPPKSTGLPSMVRVNTHLGYGSTNTVIPRFTNVVTNQGTDITYADSVTLGASFTINTAGIYAINYTAGITNASNYVGVSLDSSQLTTGIGVITAANRIASATSATTSARVHCGNTLYLPAGSVIRPHTDGTAQFGAESQFTITRVS